MLYGGSQTAALTSRLVGDSIDTLAPACRSNHKYPLVLAFASLSATNSLPILQGSSKTRYVRSELIHPLR